MDNIKYSVRSGNYPKDNSFDGKSFGALASGLLGSSVGFGLNSIASNITQANQLDMLHESNRLQRENIKFANDLTRRNALDTPRLNRLGMEGAGFNVNAEKGFSPIAGQSGLGSSGQGAQMSPVDMASFMQAFSQAELNQSQAKLADAQANEVNKLVDARLNEVLSKTDLNSVMTQLKQIEQLFANRYWSAEIAKTWSEVAQLDYSALDLETQQAVKAKQIEEFIARIANIEADTSLTPERRQLLVSQAYEARMQGLYTKEQADEYKNYIKSVIRSNNASSEVNEKEVERVATEIMVLGKELDWFEVTKVMELVQTGVSVAQAYRDVKSGRYMGSRTPSKPKGKTFLKPSMFDK